MKKIFYLVQIKNSFAIFWKIKKNIKISFTSTFIFLIVL